jgi:hypothetical protein
MCAALNAPGTARVPAAATGANAAIDSVSAASAERVRHSSAASTVSNAMAPAAIRPVGSPVMARCAAASPVAATTSPVPAASAAR